MEPKKCPDCGEKAVILLKKRVDKSGEAICQSCGTKHEVQNNRMVKKSS